MEFETLLYEVKEPIAYVTLNRPKVLNAINNKMEAELVAALEAAEADPRVSVVIMSGNGRAFSAGYDLKETVNNPVKGPIAWRRRLLSHRNQMMRVWDLHKPVIAAVHGYALGGGCDLALICDLTLAAESAFFGEPEIRFGSGVVTLIMPWALGMKKTREFLYTGHDRLPAAEAERLGMINRAVPDDRLMAEAEELALTIARIDTDAIQLTKAAINRTYENAGFRNSVDYNIEVDTAIETAETPERVEFDRIRRESGLKAAIAWRDERFSR